MLKKSIIPLGIIIFLSCTICLASEKNLKLVQSFEIQIHSNISPFIFRLVAHPDDERISQIEVLKKGDPTILQVLESRMDDKPYQNADYFQAKDFNFDGYKDIRLMIMWGATGNVIYDYWTFDPIKNIFVFHKALSSIYGDPIINYETKELSTFLRGGMVGKVYTRNTYKFMNSDLILVRQEKQDWIQEKKHFIRIIRERNNGELKTVKEEIIDK